MLPAGFHEIYNTKERKEEEGEIHGKELKNPSTCMQTKVMVAYLNILTLT